MSLPEKDHMLTLKVTAGELVDRWLIVILKIEKAEEAKQFDRAEALRKELEYAANQINDTMRQSPYTQELNRIHRILWDVEDDLRSTPEKIAELSNDHKELLMFTALKIRKYNNTRAYCVRKISEACGEIFVAKQYKSPG